MRCYSRSGPVGAFVLTGVPQRRQLRSTHVAGSAGIQKTSARVTEAWQNPAKASPSVQVSEVTDYWNILKLSLVRSRKILNAKLVDAVFFFCWRIKIKYIYINFILKNSTKKIREPNSKRNFLVISSCLVASQIENMKKVSLEYRSPYNFNTKPW